MSGGRLIECFLFCLVAVVVLTPGAHAGGSAEDAPVEEAPAERVVDTSFPGDKNGADNIAGRMGRSYEIDRAKKDFFVSHEPEVAQLVSYMYGSTGAREVALGALGKYYNEEYQNRKAKKIAGAGLADVSPLSPTQR